MWTHHGWRAMPALLLLLLAPGLARAQQLAPRHDLVAADSDPLAGSAAPAPFRLAQRDAPFGAETRESPSSTPTLPEIRNYEPLYTLTDEGNLQVLRTPSPGRLHVHGSFTLRSADYFRGRYDGVGIINRTDEVDQLQMAPSLGVTLEVLKDVGMLTHLNLVGGTVNSLAKRPPGSPKTNFWYESNNYVGLVAAGGPALLAGLTYTAYTSPNDEFPSSDELAVNFQWSGTLSGTWRLNPHVKAAWPLGSRGVYVEGGIAPEVNLGMLLHAPLTLSFPLLLGVGVDEYYGRNSDYTGYLQGGVVADLSLKRYIAASLGNWNLVASAHALGREKALRNASRQYSGGIEGADQVVVEGELALRFTY